MHAHRPVAVSMWLVAFAAALLCVIRHRTQAFLDPCVPWPHRDPADASLRGASHPHPVIVDPGSLSPTHRRRRLSALTLGFCGFFASLVSLQLRRRACRFLPGRANSMLRATTSLGRLKESTISRLSSDIVETGIAELVAKVSEIRNQMERLRVSHSQQGGEKREDLIQTELQRVFGQVDQMLGTLHDTIEDFKKASIVSQNEKPLPEFVLLEHAGTQTPWMGQAHTPWMVAFPPPVTGHFSSQCEGEVETMTEVHVVGLSHHSAPVDVRGKLSVPEREWNCFAQELVEFSSTSDGPLVQEAAVLSTCNRFEIYFASMDLEQLAAVNCVNAFLRQRSGLSREELEPYLFAYSGDDATQHLFEVSSGLDSLVLGEAQILGQVKACYGHCIAKASAGDGYSAAGCGGKMVSNMLNRAIRMGKLARTRTRIGDGAVSVSSAAVKLMQAKSLADLRKHSHRVRVCIIGAGKMSRLLILALFSKHPDIELTLVNRSIENAQALLDEVASRGGSNARVAPSSDMMDIIRDSDVVFTATACSEPIINPSDLNHRDRPLMIVDISLPRNVGIGCRDVEGVSSYSVDDLKKIQRASNAARQAEVVKAKGLIAKQVCDFRAWKLAQAAVPYIAAMQANAEDIRLAEFGKAARKLQGLQEREMDVVGKLTRHIVDGLLRPMYYSMKDEEDINTKKNKIWALKSTFRLQPLYKRGRLMNRHRSENITKHDNLPNAKIALCV